MEEWKEGPRSMDSCVEATSQMGKKVEQTKEEGPSSSSEHTFFVPMFSRSSQWKGLKAIIEME